MKISNWWKWVKEWIDKFSNKDTSVDSDPKKFKLTLETLSQVRIYGGIDWSNNDRLDELHLSTLNTPEEREKYLSDITSMREWVEVSRNQDLLASYWNLLTPAQIQELEDRINRGERITVPELRIIRPEPLAELPY